MYGCVLCVGLDAVAVNDGAVRKPRAGTETRMRVHACGVYTHTYLIADPNHGKIKVRYHLEQKDDQFFDLF